MVFRDIIPFRKRTGSVLSPVVGIQRQINQMFDQFLNDWEVFPSLQSVDRFPSLNVSETDKEVSIKAELPGIEEKDIKIDVNKNQLTIRGEKKSESEDKDKEGAYWVKEISYGSFSRSLSLPFEINSDKTKASFSKGVLTLTIEKPTENVSQTKTIPISAQ